MTDYYFSYLNIIVCYNSIDYELDNEIEIEELFLLIK